jgi:hypothetical protein
MYITSVIMKNKEFGIMKYRHVFFFFSILICVASAFSQKTIEKPYNTWGKDDAIKMLTDSPWAKTYQSPTGSANAAAGQIAREQAQSANSGGSDPRSVARNFGPPPVVMRLHSALPVRQALVRLQQLDTGYDKLNAADKASFDANRKKFLDCAICKEYYVVTLIKFTDSSGQFIEEGVFQSMTFEDLKGNVKLVNDKGEERELVQFNAPQNSRDQAVFYFKRANAAGESLLTTESKELKFVFYPSFLDSRNRFAYLIPRTFDFKVSKMMVGNSLLF